MKLYKNIITLTMRARAVYRKLKNMNQTEREFQKIKATKSKDNYVTFSIQDQDSSTFNRLFDFSLRMEQVTDHILKINNRYSIYRDWSGLGLSVLSTTYRVVVHLGKENLHMLSIKTIAGFIVYVDHQKGPWDNELNQVIEHIMEHFKLSSSKEFQKIQKERVLDNYKKLFFEEQSKDILRGEKNEF